MSTVHIRLKDKDEYVGLTEGDIASISIYDIATLLLDEESSLEQWIQCGVCLALSVYVKDLI